MGSDTQPESERALIALLRKTPAWRKLQLLDDLIATGRDLALSGLRQRYPCATPQQLRRHLADMVLGPELAAKAYGPVQPGDARNAG